MDDRGNGEWKNREGEYEGGKVRGGEGERERERERAWCDFLCDRAPQQTWEE